MKPVALLLLTAAIATPAFAQDELASYQDDRSSAPALIQSFYNAINRGEYLRAWSYYGANSYAAEDDATAGADYETFKQGYAETDTVTLLTGEATEEGAAGSTYFYLPVAIDALDKSGKRAQFAGCYTLRLAQPAIQDAPPFHALHIESGELQPVDSEALETVLPQDCTP